jgi:hypothetical protein
MGQAADMLRTRYPLRWISPRSASITDAIFPARQGGWLVRNRLMQVPAIPVSSIPPPICMRCADWRIRDCFPAVRRRWNHFTCTNADPIVSAAFAFNYLLAVAAVLDACHLYLLCPTALITDATLVSRIGDATANRGGVVMLREPKGRLSSSTGRAHSCYARR